jgi:ABC-type polysaccharide/polyol phosphate export permease
MRRRRFGGKPIGIGSRELQTLPPFGNRCAARTAGGERRESGTAMGMDHLVTPHYDLAWDDIVEGLRQWPIWGRLGWQEVKRRYRRTVLGPFWATLSLGMFLSGMVFIWAPLFKTSVASYLPFLSAGMVVWAFITALINEGCGTYSGGISLITQLNFPYSVLNYMVIWRNFIVFLHNVLIVVVVVIVLRVHVSWETLLVIPGILIVAANGIAITLLLGMIGMRFRDIPPLIANLVQILMFVTPIFWVASQLGEGAQRYIQLNYMYHLVEVMRTPMLGKAPSLLSYEITIGGALLGFLVAFEVYARFRRRIPYWL